MSHDATSRYTGQAADKPDELAEPIDEVEPVEPAETVEPDESELEDSAVTAPQTETEANSEPPEPAPETRPAPQPQRGHEDKVGSQPGELEPEQPDQAEVEHAAAEPAEAEPDTAEPAELEPEQPEPAELEPEQPDQAEVEPAGVQPAAAQPAAAEPETEPETPEPEATGPQPAAPTPQVRRAMRWRATRNQLLIATLCGLLGFALALQVRSNQTADTLRTARQSDLVRILDDLEERSTRLRSEARDLETTRDRLTTGVDRSETALEEARRRADTLGILAGTLPATGAGIELIISDPGSDIGAAILLDALQELRDAGAEAVQVDDVRVVASTHFTDGDEGVLVDGKPLTSPYRFVAIGDPATLASALDIPGGVIDTVKKEGASADVRQDDSVTIDALHLPDTPEYARPAPQPT
jgi:uncharacterized protein YlxW (UPF0749 family)